MTHIINKYDIITDLKRSLYSSYSEQVFDDENTIEFLKKAEDSLEKIAPDLSAETFKLVKERIDNAKNSKNLPNKRREDLLMASCLLN
jgi:hypothetical protein